jgi:hypothetical protein
VPTKPLRTAASELFAACIAHGADPLAGLWCIGHMAPAPWPHVHSAACRSVPVIHKATGTRATVPIWQNNQIAVTGASTWRRPVIKTTPYCSTAEAVKPRMSG